MPLVMRVTNLTDQVNHVRITIRNRDPERPICDIPCDRHHEFFTEWLHVSDEIAKAWVIWLRIHNVAFHLKVEARTEHGITGRYCMLYTHRFIIPQRGGIPRWCCNEDS
jgi:hypothetical protein